MAWWSLLGIALGLAMDAFAIAVASGIALRQINGRHIFRLAFHFGLFQFLMPIAGWAAGQTVEHWLARWDHWLAFALLTAIGGKMLWEAAHGEPDKDRGDPTRGLVLVSLSLATSMDALAVGLSMALLQVSIWFPAVVIGLVAGAMTTLGITCGSRIGAKWGRAAELTGGLVLLLIGLRVLFSHLGAG